MRIRRVASLGLICFGLMTGQLAQANDAPIHAAHLFPPETQGMVRVDNLPKILERWEQTQFGSLGKLEGMLEFWEEQRQHIEERLADAGWHVTLTPEDIHRICTGQVAIAWIDRSANIRKPYSVGAVIDIAGNEEDTARLIRVLGEDLKKKQATAESTEFEGIAISKYTMPRKAGETMIVETYFAQVPGQLFIADDLPTIKGMISASKSSAEQGLAASEVYKNSFGQIETLAADKDVEYFVRPIGLAKVVRSISKKAKVRQNDILKALEKQGFDRLLAASGRLRISGPEFDVYHDGFVLAPQPLPTSVQILDFPNQAGKEVPSWVTNQSAAVSSVAWNAKEAFWKVQGVFDEVAGQEGTFDAVIEGIQEDPLGPQIDVAHDIMPYLTNEIYSAHDTIQPIAPDSKRTLIAVRVTDAGKLATVLDRAMKVEPDAKSLDYHGLRIWQVNHETDEGIELSVDEGFGDFGAKKKKSEDEEEENHLLNNWAITIHQDFFLFSSHVEMLQEALDLQLAGKTSSEIVELPEFRRARLAIDKLSDGKDHCAWQVVLNDRAFQMQYELFRQDKLPQSKSMLATIVERLLNPKSEVRDQTQKVKGDRLPSFDIVRKYLMPSGLIVRTTPQGWSIRSFILAGNPTELNEATSALTAERSEVGIAAESSEGSGSGTKR